MRTIQKQNSLLPYKYTAVRVERLDYLSAHVVVHKSKTVEGCVVRFRLRTIFKKRRLQFERGNHSPPRSIKIGSFLNRRKLK